MIPNQLQPTLQISSITQIKSNQPILQSKPKIPITQTKPKEAAHQNKSKQPISESKKKQLKPQIKQKQLTQRPKTNATSAHPLSANVTKPSMKKQEIHRVNINSPSVVIQIDADTLASPDPNIMTVGALHQFVIEDPSVMQLYSQPIISKFILKPLAASHVQIAKFSSKISTKKKQQKASALDSQKVINSQSKPSPQANERIQNPTQKIESSVEVLKDKHHDQLANGKKNQQATQQVIIEIQPKPQKTMDESRETSNKILKIEQQKQQIKNMFIVVFNEQNIQKLQDIQLRLQDQYIQAWIIQLFYFLHPYVRADKNDEYFKIQKNHIFVEPSPFLQEIFNRNEEYQWENPFRVLIDKKTKNQTEYLSQLSQFGSKLANIKNFEGLQSLYYSTKLGNSYNQLLTVENLALKIKNSPHETASIKQIKQHKFDFSSGPISQQTMKWIVAQTGLDTKSKPYIHCRASKSNYDPIKFWSSICTIHKADQPSQLLVIQINGEIGQQSRLVGFYASIVPGNADMSKQPPSEYIPDKDKKSLLLNISLKTVHRLADGQHTLAFSNKILVCIGKCDIIISAFNITNLCYFPVSFKPDVDGYCSKADQLCGSKQFGVKELYVYRFQKKV